MNDIGQLSIYEISFEFNILSHHFSIDLYCSKYISNSTVCFIKTITAVEKSVTGRVQNQLLTFYCDGMKENETKGNHNKLLGYSFLQVLPKYCLTI